MKFFGPIFVALNVVIFAYFHFSTADSFVIPISRGFTRPYLDSSCLLNKKIKKIQINHCRLQVSLFPSFFIPDSIAIPLAKYANSLVIDSSEKVVDWIFGDREYAKFFALETVARVPYFAYTSVLHFYETMGMFRKSEYLKLHFAESWNELHHLKIMEYLGGDGELLDRIVARIAAFAYYWIVVTLYFVSPAIAYNLSQQIEEHAYRAYDSFITKNEKMLKSQPVPPVAKEYYEENSDGFLDGFRYPLPNSSDSVSDDLKLTRSNPRGKMKSLYDTFVHIRDDEMEHVKTMKVLQEEVRDGKLP